MYIHLRNKSKDIKNKENLLNNISVVNNKGERLKVFKFSFREKGFGNYPVTTRMQAFKSREDVKKWLDKKERTKSKETSYPIRYELLTCEVVG